MKILVICHHYYPENFAITNLCEGFVNAGHDVTVVTGKPNYGYGYILPEYKHVKFEAINGVKVNRVNLSPRHKSKWSIIKYYLTFWHNSKIWVRRCKEEFDIVFTMSLSPVTVIAGGNLYAKKHHVKHVVYCVDLWPESTVITHAVRKNSLFYKIIYRWSYLLYKNSSRVIIGSPSFKDYFYDVLNIKDKSFDFVPQPALISESDIEPYKYEKAFNILFCGNLGIIQHPEYIPEAMRLVDDKNIHFHIIGMGPKSGLIQKMIKEYNLEDRVIYHGPMIASKAAAYFKSADALYVSLESSGVVGKTIPNKLVMYMAFEKPILAMLKGDGRHILEQSGGGYFVDENIEDIANGIKAISKVNKDTLIECGKKNREYYLNNLTTEKAVDSILKILEEEAK